MANPGGNSGLYRVQDPPIAGFLVYQLPLEQPVNLTAAAGLSADVNLLSDESKLLLLTHLYLELRLNLEDALRAARADIIMTAKAQNHRLWVERRQ